MIKEEFYAYEADHVDLNKDDPSTYVFKYIFTEDYVEITSTETKVLFWKVKGQHYKLYYDEMLQVILWGTPNMEITMDHKNLHKSTCANNKYSFMVYGMDKALVEFLNRTPAILGKLNAFNRHKGNNTRDVLLNVEKKH